MQPPSRTFESSPAASTLGLVAQPNDLDRKRIERALSRRRRYRYVVPSVHMAGDGYLVKSPCCSRNVDAAGGVIDIAILRHAPGAVPAWGLFRKNHTTNQWLLYARYVRIGELLRALSEDPERVFWQ